MPVVSLVTTNDQFFCLDSEVHFTLMKGCEALLTMCRWSLGLG